MKVLVCGKGQLGMELQRSCPASVELSVLGRDQLDITDPQAVTDALAALQPQAIINAAAYTRVDHAETDVAAAWSVNHGGPRNLISAVNSTGAYLLHLSTDFVFSGDSSRPYEPSDPVGPLGVYGESKLAGEAALMDLGRNNWAVLRTAWVFSAHGNNFVKTILRLLAEKPRLTIIADQVGSPTWAHLLAETCWQAVTTKLQGIHHCTCDGVASWYDFALAIQELAVARGLSKTSCEILPIRTEDYPTPAKRPHYSVLSNDSLKQALPQVPRRHWRQALGLMLDELAQS